MPYIPCDWPIGGIFGPETFVNHPGAIPQSAAPEAEPQGVNKYAEALRQWAESQRNTMTTKQLEIVRELRLYHTPSLFMEAAAEIERLVVKLTVAVADRAAAERKIEQLENRVFALEGELEQAS